MITFSLLGLLQALLLPGFCIILWSTRNQSYEFKDKLLFATPVSIFINYVVIQKLKAHKFWNIFHRHLFAARASWQRESFQTDVCFDTVRRMSLLAKSGKPQRVERGKTFSFSQTTFSNKNSNRLVNKITIVLHANRCIKKQNIS